MCIAPATSFSPAGYSVISISLAYSGSFVSLLNLQVGLALKISPQGVTQVSTREIYQLYSELLLKTKVYGAHCQMFQGW